VGVPLDYRVWVFVANLNLRLIINLSTNTIMDYSYRSLVSGWKNIDRPQGLVVPMVRLLSLVSCLHKQRPSQKPKWPKHESIDALTESASVSILLHTPAKLKYIHIPLRSS